MGKFTFDPKMKKNVKNVSKSPKIQFHPQSIAYFSFKGPYFPLTGISKCWAYCMDVIPMHVPGFEFPNMQEVEEVDEYYQMVEAGSYVSP